MSATLHILKPLPARLAVRRYHGVAWGDKAGRIETDIDAVDPIDAQNQLIDQLGEIPRYMTVQAVTGAAVGEHVETEPSGSGALDSLDVPGPAQVAEAARTLRKAQRSARQQHRQLMRGLLGYAVLIAGGLFGLGVGAIGLARALWGGA